MLQCLLDVKVLIRCYSALLDAKVLIRCNKGHGMCYPVCGMMHIKAVCGMMDIKEPLLLIGKSLMPYNHK